MTAAMFSDWIRPVPHPLGDDGRWPSGHLWSGRNSSCPRFDLPPAGLRTTRAHTGTDIAGVLGTFIVSPADGIVESWSFNTEGGYVVVVKHQVRQGRKLITVWSRHAHCLARQIVRPGEVVRRGDAIALLGSTGGSASPHNHTSVTLTAQLPSWQDRHLFLDPEPIYYPGSYEYMQQGHPFPKEVRKVQRRLNALGADPPLKVDGDYGAKTTAAVKVWETGEGLEAHGALNALGMTLLFRRAGKET